MFLEPTAKLRRDKGWPIATEGWNAGNKLKMLASKKSITLAVGWNKGTLSFLQSGGVMQKGVTLLSGIGIGAALMYVLDPDRGRRRRALMKDKARHLTNKTADEAGKMSRDLSNRVKGLMAETRARLTEDDIPDDVLVDRVKAAMGHVGAHDGAIEVSARNGIVTLSGKALVNELPALIAAVRDVRAVNDVVSDLQVYQDSNGIPELEGSVFRKAAGN